MEEYIKILEELKEAYIFNLSGFLGMTRKEQKRKAYAIGNLIKGYRDSENIMENAVKENLELKKYIRELEEQIDKHVYFETTNPKEIEKNFIPKSKIKEKIEEINSELEEKYSAEKISVFSGNTYMEKFKLLGKLQALQELMEDK